VGVKTPPYIPPRMMKGAASPQTASVKAFQISAGVPQRSPRQPFFQEITKQGMMRNSPTSSPGIAPAANRAEMDVPVMTP